MPGKLETIGLRHRVTLLEPTYTRDSHGQRKISSWSEVAEVWADVREVSGREVWRENHPAAETDVTVAIRYRNDVATSWRVQWQPGGRMLEILARRDLDGGRTWLILECKEVK